MRHFVPHGSLVCGARLLALPVCVTLMAGLALAQASDPPEIEGANWLGMEGSPGRFDIIMANLGEGSLPDRVFVHARDASNYLAVDFSGASARLSRALGGPEELIAEARLPEGYASEQVVIEWRFDRIRVYAGHQVLIQHYEHGLVSGHLGYLGDIGEAQLWGQPIDRVSFADNYGRLEANMGDWLPETGEWSNIQSEGEARESANPFVFEGRTGVAPPEETPIEQSGAARPRRGRRGRVPVERTADPSALFLTPVLATEAEAEGATDGAEEEPPEPPRALATTGYPFWTDYFLETAIRSETASAMGLVALCEPSREDGPSRHYVLARWTSQTDSSEEGDKIQIVRVANGVHEVLAEAPGGFVPMQWYRMRLAVDDDLTVTIDGREALRVANESGYGRGRPGLYVEGYGAARFDDTRVDQIDTMAFSFPGDAVEWRTSPGIAAVSEGVTGRDAGGLLVYPRLLGNVDLTVELAAAGSSGEAMIAYRGPEEHWAIAWHAGTADNLRLIRRSTAGEELLATGSAPIEPGRPAALRVVANKDLFRVQWDGRTAVERAEALRLNVPESPSQIDSEELEEGSGPPLVGALALRLGAGPSPVVRAIHVDQPKKPRAAELTEQFALETGTMAEWATTAGAWIDPGTMGASMQAMEAQRVEGAQAQQLPPEAPLDPVWWNKGDFYGDTEVRASFGAGEGSASVHIGCTDYKTDSGYEFVINPVADALSLRILRHGVLLAEGSMPSGVTLPAVLSFQVRGGLLTVGWDDGVALQAHDPEPLKGTKVGLSSHGLPLDYNAVYAFAVDQEDYTFSDAPAEWTEVTGTWELSSRWTCSQEWSWWSGRSEEGALMWSKPAFGPDVTVELYAAMKMGLASASGRQYKHPENINITLCGDGTSVASGYSFVLGGAGDSKTQIWKGSRVLAETDDPKAMLPRLTDSLPSMNDFHRKWWQVRAEKQGNRLRLYLDDYLALEVRDNEPLESGHVGVWTYDNGIMVARTKIYGPRTGDILSPRVLPETIEARYRPPSVPLAPVSSSSHAALIQDFENGLGEFETFYHAGLTGPGAEPNGGREQGALVLLDEQDAHGEGHSVRLVNKHPGGTFGVYAMTTDFVPSSHGILTFDYKIGPEVAVDVILGTETADYRIAFTGGDNPVHGVVDLGAIEGVQADNLWHSARFDIRGHLQALGIDPTQVTVTYVAVGAFQRDKMLQMGVTANPKGATWWLDNFGVCNPGGSVGRFTWPAIDGAVAYRYTASVSPTLEMNGEAAVVQEPSVELANLMPGAWYLHVAPLGADGVPLGSFRHRFESSSGDPTVYPVLTEGARAVPGGWLALAVDNVPSGLVPESVRVLLNGEELGPDSSGVRVDTARSQVLVDLDRALEPSDRCAAVQVGLLSAESYAGHAVSGGPFTIEVDRSLNVTPPTAPVVTEGGAPFVFNDFENDLGQWSTDHRRNQGAAALTLDPTTAASGGSSLRLTKSAEAGSFAAWAISEPFDAGRHRLISFDYKIDPWVRIDMRINLQSTRTWHVIKMTDNDNDGGGQVVLGHIPIVADGQWRHAEIDLYTLLLSRFPDAQDYQVSRVGFASGGWDGNSKGSYWNIDNFRISSIASARERLVVKWENDDPSGIDGASYVLDREPDTEPDTQVKTRQSALSLEPGLPDGWHWLHLRAVDRQGNWSPTTHHRVFLDSQGPVVHDASFENGSRLCIDRFTLTLADRGSPWSGVDPTSLRLRVGDSVYPVDGRVLQFRGDTGQLEWNAQRARPEPLTFADQQVVTVALEEARDHAGNPLEPGFLQTFVMDFSLDEGPPDPPEIQSPTHMTAVFEPFETLIGSAGKSEGCRLDIGRDGLGGPGDDRVLRRIGTGCLRVTRTPGDSFSTQLLTVPVDLREYPNLAFDYRCPPEAKLDMVLTVTKGDGPVPVVVRFTNPTTEAPFAVRGAVADGAWRYAELNLLDVARQILGDSREYRLLSLAVTDPASPPSTPVDATVDFDNLWVTRGGDGALQFTWSAWDPTGIQGFSWVYDDVAYTIPPAEVMGTDRALDLPEQPGGRRYLHVRAQDKAGNWSETAHLAVYEQER